uniref:Poly(A) binding protein interacting protein 2B n=1 Tax=Cairina moschata TaxID=8855 RepID=A0A8C3GP15_CAIMO
MRPCPTESSPFWGAFWHPWVPGTRWGPLICAKLGLAGTGRGGGTRLCASLRGLLGQVEEELQEQEFLDRCFQEMLEEEDQDWFIPARDLPQQQLSGVPVADGHASEDILSKSNLNPDAKEFVPGVKY